MENENEIIDSIPQSLARRRLSSLQFFAERFFIRSFRICSGIVVFLIALWFFSESSDISEMPFTGLTLKLIGQFVFDVIIGILLSIWSWAIAFGKAPERQ